LCEYLQFTPMKRYEFFCCTIFYNLSCTNLGGAVVMLWQDGKGGARTALWMIDLVSDREKITI
ncbi:hypothetical protein K1J10_08995, partial [Streptococcus australis]|uniref:hypothetical protein n=1 Tax=Streptococcus australis TaxID=113107 RepID=UPI001CBC03CB